MLGEELEIHPRLVVVALEVGLGGELEEIAIPDLALRQQVHVIALVGATEGPVEPGAVGDVGLDPDDRLDPDLPRRLDEVDHAVEDAVIGDCDGGLAIGCRRSDHVPDSGRAVEHRIFGVDVKVGE